MNDLVDRYTVQVPRYTSYPPASSWTQVSEPQFLAQPLSGPLSLYFHIPFCPSQCSYCGCASIASKDHTLYEQYVQTLRQEIRLMAKAFPLQPIAQIHFGGGTPNSLKTTSLVSILDTVKEEFSLLETAELAIELDPRLLPNCALLASAGFTRVSLGIQDINATVQEAIGRRQSQEVSEEAFRSARRANLSINIDLVYGLPYQTKDSFSSTIDWVLSLLPDRLALFSFAYLPDAKPNQKAILKHTLPSIHEKFDIFLAARKRLIDRGYIAIGLDHFALPHDPLAQGNIHRNFQGYTCGERTTLLGLGLTAISDFHHGLFQHTKDLPSYMASIKEGHIPIERGALLSLDDQIRRFVIDRLMCRYAISKDECETKWHIDFDTYFSKELHRLALLRTDGLVFISKEAIGATQTGQLFLRNIASCFDFYTQTS